MKQLENIRVIDVSRLLPGAYCSLILKDFGAEVIKVEDPQTGDYMRLMPPFLKGGVSANFAMVNRGKKSVVLDLKSAAGKKSFLKLLKTADIVIEGFRPGTMKRLGFGYEQVKKINSKLIYCSLSGYGATGPYKDLASHDLNYLCLSGILHPPKKSKEPPFIPPTQFADICGGSLMAAISILAALLERNKTKKGKYIHISLLDGTMALMILSYAQLQVPGDEYHKWDMGLRGFFPNYALYKTKDGRFIGFCPVERKFWDAFCDKIKRKDLKDKLPSYMGLRHIPQNVVKGLFKELGKVFLSKTFHEWEKFFKKTDVCLTPLWNKEEMMKSSYVRERKLFVRSPFKGFTYLRTPFTLPQLSREDLKVPQLGEDTKRYA